MSDVNTTLSAALHSLPARLAAGAAVAGVIWQLFARLDDLLAEDTKKEIAHAVGSLSLGDALSRWIGTFSLLFDRVFGAHHFSFRCFVRCAVASVIAMAPLRLLSYPVPAGDRHSVYGYFYSATCVLLGNVLPDYVAYFFTRQSIRVLTRSRSWPVSVVVITLDIICTFYVACLGYMAAFYFYGMETYGDLSMYLHIMTAFLVHPRRLVLHSLRMVGYYDNLSFVLPAFLTTIWLWLYICSAALVRVARRIDVLLRWLTKVFDIEKKPLSVLGLAAATLVAVPWWLVVIIDWVVG